MILLSEADFPISYNVALPGEREARRKRERRQASNLKKFRIKPMTGKRGEREGRVKSSEDNDEIAAVSRECLPSELSFDASFPTFPTRNRDT